MKQLPTEHMGLRANTRSLARPVTCICVLPQGTDEKTWAPALLATVKIL